MFRQAKYIVGEYYESEMGVKDVVAIVFDNFMFHSSVARLFRKIYGAGFVELDDGEVTVFGRSESLNVDSRQEDVKLIEKSLRLA